MAEGEASRRLWLLASEEVAPSTDSADSRSDAALAGCWQIAVDRDDWCVDASARARSEAAGSRRVHACAEAMPARERRALSLRMARVQAQAVLTAAEPALARPRRWRRVAVVVGSVAVHAAGVALLLWVAGERESLRDDERVEAAREPVEIVALATKPLAEPPAAAPLPAEPAAEPRPSVEPQPVARRRPARRPAPQPAASVEPPAAPAPAGPVRLRNVSFGSAGAKVQAGALTMGGGGSGGEGGAVGSDSAGGDGSLAAGSGGEGVDERAQPRGALVEPEYPRELERKGVSGTVLVEVAIDEHGHVLTARLVKGSGHEDFDHNALVAARRQDWAPAVRNGKPVASHRRYRIHFRPRR